MNAINDTVGDRVTMLFGVSATMPGVRLDKSQKGGAFQKVRVVTMCHNGKTKAGVDKWKTKKEHATFYGAIAKESAATFIKIMESGSPIQPENICVADGVGLSTLTVKGGHLDLEFTINEKP